jgi:oxygen-independent coproporphyrinogen-3 oxidase
MTGPGLYVHWPFCASKCGYCDFASVAAREAGGEGFIRRYAQALKQEWAQRRASPEFAEAEFRTIYFGGGTPTVAPLEALLSVAAAVRITGGQETSIEANPESAEESKLAALRGAGFNRLSLGVQSFSDEVLRFLGRAHTVSRAREAIRAARRAAFENLSLDLIYGSPGETLGEWQTTLESAIQSGPEHISAYGLTLEPGTPLGRRGEQGELSPTSPELQAEMYWRARERLTGAGYEHYEVSNFARRGFACLHNRNYWRRGEYLGLGASAHSFRGGVRWRNVCSPQAYVAAVERRQLPVAGAERLSRRQSCEEFLFLGLRQSEGVAKAELEARFGRRAARAVRGRARGLAMEGLLAGGDGRLRLPPRAMLISNQVLERLLDW